MTTLTDVPISALTAYGILAQTTYVQRFWEELEQPPPRLPITKDSGLFTRVARHGARLLYLHTYGDRFGGPNDNGTVPQGQVRCTKGVSPEKYPTGFSYNNKTEVLIVGDGEFTPVKPDVWNYSVSGLQVVKSWLDRRKLKRSGRQSSPLDRSGQSDGISPRNFLSCSGYLKRQSNSSLKGRLCLQRCVPSMCSRERNCPARLTRSGNRLAISHQEGSNLGSLLRKRIDAQSAP